MTARPRDEAGWIRYIRTLWGPSGAALDVGDDAAVLPSAPYALTTDALLEGVDFERPWGPPEAVGHKALAVNLSDLAAVGARPRFCLLTLALPEGLADRWVEDLLRGMHRLALREGVGLCGGDLSRSRSGVVVSLTALGLLEGPPLTRSGGRPGDLLFVSGPLGAARAALKAFRQGASLRTFGEAPPRTPRLALLDRFFRPPSQTETGLHLSREKLASAALDLSDGFARDLHRLLAASRCGAEVEARAVPVDPLCGSGEEARREALLGGEDQVLLFAVPERKAAKVTRILPGAVPVGRLRRRPGCDLLWPGGGREPLSPSGFDHFRPEETSAPPARRKASRCVFPPGGSR